MVDEDVATTGFVYDAALPNRDTLLDEAVMAGVLSDALGGDTTVSSVRRRRVKYRVGESIRVLYEVESSSGELLIALRGFSPGSGRRALAPNSSATLRLPELRAAAWIFPVDRKIRSLERFVSDADVRSEAVGCEVDEIELMAYAPEKHATFRCVSHGRTIGFAKLFEGEGHVRSAELHRRISSELASVGVAAPEVTAVDDNLGLVMLSPLAGEELATVGKSNAWYELGIATAKLHSIAKPEVLGRFGRLSIDSLRSSASLISMARPDVSEQTARLLERLETLGAELSEAPDVVLHGDLHSKNAMLNAGVIGFIDLDQAAIGTARTDLASAIAALRYSELIAPGTTPPGAVEMLLEGYDVVGNVPSSFDLAWHTAAALLAERALRAVNRVRVDGLAKLDEVISLAHQALTTGADK